MKDIGKKSFAAISAAVLLMSGYFIAGVLLFANALYNEVNTRDMEEAVQTLGVLVPPSLFDAGREGEAAAWIGRFRGTSPYRFTLIRPDGKVIAETERESDNMENHLNRPEFQSAVSEGTGIARRVSATLGQDYVYAAVTVRGEKGEEAGVFRISRLIPSFSGRFAAGSLPFLFCGFLLILGGCIELYRFSRSLSRSLELKLDTELEAKTRELTARTAEAEAEGRRREAILDSMSEGVMALNGDLRIIMANPRLCSLFDAGEEIAGLSLLELSHSAELEEAARQVLTGGKPVEMTLNRHVSGASQYLQVRAAPMGGDRGIVMALGDITRLVRLEQIRKDFAANVSHELRTPIQVIKGFAETLLESPPENREGISHFAEIIARNAQRMENITTDLMTLVSLEDENSPRPPREETAAAPLIAEAVDMAEAAARKKNILIETECSPDLRAKLYGPLVVQALINLLDNGIKYSEKGSRLWVSAFLENRELVIEVKDEGIGIPAEHLDRIFERFYRVDRARSREAGGTGLGLAIVRHICLLHNGKAEAESHTGEGSVFRLRLPM
jgi:two-component system phosphate regulon sensor histidine kinase PhoR